nr:HEPN domain-containing protein [Brevibacillus halotolerans]
MVFTYGKKYEDSTGTFYHVAKAFLFKETDSKDFVDDKIHGVTSFSFEIPELVDWLKLQSVELFYDNNEGMIIKEKKLIPILLKATNPKIYIKYETNFPFLNDNDKIEMTLRNAPRVFVEYEGIVDDSVVVDDIGKIMRFFALLMGRISYANDIRVKLKDKMFPLRLYLNKDFSHNINSNAYGLRFRTDVEKVFGNLQSYFEKWYSFSESQFTYLLDVFFRFNGKTTIRIEDLFLNYCKFLEGYDLRISEDEKKANNLRDKLNEVLKDQTIKTKLSPIIIEAGSSKYKPKEIAKWISNGFLGRVSLQERIKRLDEKYLKILSANSFDIIKKDDVNEFFKKLSMTRNYYSHFKTDSTDIFSLEEIYRTIELLDALVVAILLSEMGLSVEEIKQIMIRDGKYWVILIHQRQNAESAN